MHHLSNSIYKFLVYKYKLKRNLHNFQQYIKSKNFENKKMDYSSKLWKGGTLIMGCVGMLISRSMGTVNTFFADLKSQFNLTQTEGTNF